MGCSSGRQPPASMLHPELDRANGCESNTLAMDVDNQNQNSNGSTGGGEEGRYSSNGGGEGGGEQGGDRRRNLTRPLETLPTLERLAQATGGTEKSWYRCVFPFGVIFLVIGMAGTGVTFTFNTLPQTKVVSVALLCVGVLMLLMATVCWRGHRRRRRRKTEGAFTCSEQGTL